MKTIIRQKHRSGCIAVRAAKEGLWKSPWILETRLGHRSLDSLGRDNANGGAHRWLKFSCNSRQCGAWGLVRVDDIEAAIWKEKGE